MRHLHSALLAIILSYLPISVHAQQLVGECYEYSGAVYGIFDNYFVQQRFNNQNAAFAYRDPTGQTIMRLPALNPMNAIWLNWNLQMVLINNRGWRVIGNCQLHPAFIQQSRVQTHQMPTRFVSVAVGGINQGHAIQQETRVPAQLVDPEIEFIKPALPDVEIARACERHLNDEVAFVDCMAERSMGKKEFAYYQCARQFTEKGDIASCLLKSSMGRNEQRALGVAHDCYKKYGNDWDKYPLCAVENGVSFDERTVKGIQCLKNSTGDEIDYMSLGICYLGDDFVKSMNQESLIAMQCAATSGTEPMAFVSCTGGALAAMEISKCFTQGIGGKGCFGDGNTLVRLSRDIEREIGQHFGPNSEAVRAWNLFMQAGNQSKEVTKVVNNTVREMERAGKNIEREVRKVVPKIKIKW